MGKIHRVNPERLLCVIDFRTPLGLFLTKEGRKWVAVDNTTGDAWTEEFSRKRQAMRWLKGEFEVGDRAKNLADINTADQMVAVAMLQGIVMTSEEADVVLGYLEGHDFYLIADADGNTVRHDMLYENIHRGDRPCTIQDAVWFCQEMNEDLIHDNPSNKEYLIQLRKDKQILDALVARLIDIQPVSEIAIM